MRAQSPPDPDIDTCSGLGDIFADGNVITGFRAFESTHECNKFCKFFKLPTDYKNWVLDLDNIEGSLGCAGGESTAKTGVRAGVQGASEDDSNIDGIKDMSISKAQ